MLKLTFWRTYKSATTSDRIPLNEVAPLKFLTIGRHQEGDLQNRKMHQKGNLKNRKNRIRGGGLGSLWSIIILKDVKFCHSD